MTASLASVTQSYNLYDEGCTEAKERFSNACARQSTQSLILPAGKASNYTEKKGRGRSGVFGDWVKRPPSVRGCISKTLALCQRLRPSQPFIEKISPSPSRYSNL